MLFQAELIQSPRLVGFSHCQQTHALIIINEQTFTPMHQFSLIPSKAPAHHLPPSRAIRNHAHDAAIVAPIADLEPPVLVTGGTRRVLGGDAPERRGSAVADARRQGGIAAGVDAGVAAREGDVGVAEDGEGDVAVVEAAGQVAELDAVVAGVAVGEPGDVLAAGGRC